MELVFTVCTGTKFSVCVPGAKFRRRPLSSTSVLPVPRLRRLIDEVSPRASLRLPVVRDAWNCTSPACGIARNSSSPETAAVAMISFCPTTVTGRAPVVRAPTICEPTTTTSCTAVDAEASAAEPVWGAGAPGGGGVCVAWASAPVAQNSSDPPASSADLNLPDITRPPGPGPHVGPA